MKEETLPQIPIDSRARRCDYRHLVSLAFRRNDPCPCGSKRKFKHCHLHAVSLNGPPTQSTPLSLKEISPRQLAPFHVQNWIEYCRQAYRGNPAAAFCAALFDVSEVAESMERAIWRLQYSKLSDRQAEVETTLSDLKSQLSATLRLLGRVAELVQTSPVPEATIDAVLDWEEVNLDEPEPDEDTTPRYSELVLNMLRGGRSIGAEVRPRFVSVG